VVTFVPADLSLVSGAPVLRRTFLNLALAQAAPAYFRALARYNKIIAQKGALLRGAIAPDRDLLLAYNEELAAPGRVLVAQRGAFVAEIAAAAAGVYERWHAARERIDVRYVPNLGSADIADALSANVDNELRRRQALVGPHRDDIRIELEGRPLAAYGSQGQQRTAVLALKVGEYEVMRSRTGDAPILLLDDVLSELDAERAAGFLAALGTFEQAFLTTTDVPAGFAGDITIYTVRGGAVERGAC
jgi:DNA replication and repair protein RecF